MSTIDEARHYVADDSNTYERGVINGEIRGGEHKGRLLEMHPFDEGTTSLTIGFDHATKGRQAFEVVLLPKLDDRRYELAAIA